MRDLDQAWAQAMKAIEELREDEEDVADWENWSLEVTDASGKVLFSINLGKTFH